MESLTETRQAFLEEMLNISFGRAAASLAERLNVFVTLDVPNAHEIEQTQISSLLEQRVGLEQDIIVVQQVFSGDFKGEVLLVVGADLVKQAVSIMSQEGGFAPNLPVAELETEVILEIGNILIGACMGQFSGLLSKSVRYETPDVLLDKASIDNLHYTNQHTDKKALIVMTKFHLGEKALSGYLFILLDQRWFDAMYVAVDQFIEQLAAE
ncbi:MAG: hypothetical protein V1736_08140 [Pseudomonadota bacterium]